MKTARKSRDNAYASIRSKLVAAVAMLLVASFMVVSSSYAWFTLSTAPEVTGITTTVGANGSLEIALYTGQSDITSAVGDTGNYETWGNLVDLSNAKYGLDKIVLLPSAMSAAGAGTTDSPYTLSSMLTPTYGADGRVDQLQANTILASFANDVFATQNDANGVSAIGTASGQTLQESHYNGASQDIKTFSTQVQNKVRDALNAVGGQVGSAAVDYQLSQNATTTYDVSGVPTMLSSFDAAQVELQKLIIAYCKTLFAKGMQGYDEAVYQAAWTAMDWDNMTVDEIKEDVTFDDDSSNATEAKTFYSIPIVKAAVDLYDSNALYISTMNTNVGVATTGKTDLDTTADVNEVYQWTYAEIKSVFMDNTYPLIPMDSALVNGKTIEQIAADKNAFISDYLNTKECNIVLCDVTYENGAYTTTETQKKGLFVNYGEITGNYQTAIKLNVASFGIEVDANMKVDIKQPDALLKSNIVSAPVKNDTGNTNKTLSDLYGYVIDLAFRTNAAGSNLLLQVDPTDRIYSDNSTTSQTYGAGSYMEFTTATPGFTVDQMAELMKAIRVVFVTPGADEDDPPVILGVGVLDMKNAIPDASAGTVTAKLALADYELENIGTEASPVNIISVTKETVTEGTATGTYSKLAAKYESTSNYKLMALNQNATQYVSAYVYLDGQEVTNQDVADFETSMKGSLNLQFSSSANLVPMDYAPLKSAAEMTEIAVNDVPTAGTINTELDLPTADTNSNAVTWTVESGTATVTGNKLTATAAGDVVVKATSSAGSKTYTITFSEAVGG